MKLVIEKLSKRYDNGVQALDNISLTIGVGMFGLLGPNGAGKSTLMRTLATLQNPDSGSVTFNGLDLLVNKKEIRAQLGYLPQEFGVYPKMSAETLLNHLAVLKGLTQKTDRKEVVELLLQRTNLWNARHRALGSFSGGMKQRFGIAQALLANPRLIIVDEPTAGLDPQERNRFLNLLSEIGENTIVILSTHIVDDVRELCSRMAIIQQGRLLYTGSPTDALTELEGKIWKVTIHPSEYDEYSSQYRIVSEKLTAGRREIHVLGNQRPSDLFESVAVDLEDVYFSHILKSDRKSLR